MPEKVRITYDELNNPKVDEILARLEEESALRKGMGASQADVRKVSLINRSWFNLMLAGLAGALIAWAVIEPQYEDSLVVTEEQTLFTFLLFASVGGLAAMMIGSMEGILARNIGRAFKGGIIGLIIGFAGGLITTFLAGLIMNLIFLAGAPIIGIEAASNPTEHFSAFVLVVIARSLAWTIAGMTVGLGPGIALKSGKLALNGFIGGMIGGLAGGLLFDPVNYFVSGGSFMTGVEWSRAIGLGIIGASAGLMIGLVELITKDAWLLMSAGPLKGKQFVIYKNPTVIGSSPKCEVYLFRDSAVEPFHASIHSIRDGYEIEDMGTVYGTWVNGRKIKRQRLAGNDVIQIGDTRFVYSEKEKKAKK